MIRFSILFVLGGLLVLGGQVWLSVNLHPDSPSGSMDILFPVVAVAIGAAVAGTAMLGMANCYEQVAARAARFLAIKIVPAQPPPVGESAHLNAHNRSFWRSYTLSSLALCLFLVGLLSVSVALADSAYLLYLIGLSGGIAVLGTLSLLMGASALMGVRRVHAAVTRSIEVLSHQPDIPTEIAPPPTPPRARWVRPRRPRGDRSIATNRRPPLHPTIVR